MRRRDGAAARLRAVGNDADAFHSRAVKAADAWVM